MFTGPFDTSMLKKAQDDGLVDINIHNLRNWAKDKHKTVDGRPYGGGPGMILRVDVIDRALQDIKKLSKKVRNTQQVAEPNRDDKDGPNSLPSLSKSETKVILLSAKGETYTQQIAQQFAKLDHLILSAGHYEGVDERVAEHLIDEEVSIGNYVLTGGEIPAMVITDSVARLIPGVLGNPQSLIEESHSPNISHHSPITEAEYPQYTRPDDHKGWKVPEVLLSGNHAEIEKWRKGKSKKVI